MGNKSNKWINFDDFIKLKTDDRLKIRFMNGIAIVQKILSDDEIVVMFEGGCWNNKEINIIRHQVNKIY